MVLCKVTLVLVAVAAVSAYPVEHGHAESYDSIISLPGHGHDYREAESDDHHHIIWAYPKYDFKYGVEDHHTGDHKEQKEEREGHVVKGEYSFLQPDGRKRIVHYTASKHGGFNAIVSYSGHAIHPQHYEHSSY